MWCMGRTYLVSMYCIRDLEHWRGISIQRHSVEIVIVTQWRIVQTILWEMCLNMVSTFHQLHAMIWKHWFTLMSVTEWSRCPSLFDGYSEAERNFYTQSCRPSDLIQHLVSLQSHHLKQCRLSSARSRGIHISESSQGYFNHQLLKLD